MRQRDLPHQALEQHHLVGQPDRGAMIEIDLELRGAGFMDQRVDLEFRHFGVLIDVLDQILIFGDRFQPIGLRRRLGAPRSSGRRHQRQVGVGIDLRQVEFQLRGDHRAPALRLVKPHHRLQHVAGCDLIGRIVAAITVGDDEGGGRAIARGDADGRQVRPQDDVGVEHRGIVVLLLGIFAGDGQGVDRARDAQRSVAFAFQELLRREHLAAHDAVHVRHQTFDLADAVLADPALETEALGFSRVRHLLPRLGSDRWRGPPGPRIP